MTMTNDVSATEIDSTDDWGSAMAEQAQATIETNVRVETPSATERLFQPLPVRDEAKLVNSDIDRVLDVPVQLTTELGRTRITIKNLLQLNQGSVIELDGLAGEPMDVFVNGFLIAKGEVVVVKDKFGIRLTDIVTASERIQQLAR